MNKFLESRAFTVIICVIAAIIVILLVFKVGLMVGVRKADFSCRWSDNYHRNFGGPDKGFLAGLGDRNFIEASGAFGQIIKIDGKTVVMNGKDNVEKIIVVDDKTSIQNGRQTVKSADLKVGDLIVVIGEPDELGKIEAKLIRVMPPIAAPSFPKV